MPIEILSERQSAATPVLWRNVATRAQQPAALAEPDSGSVLEHAKRDGFANGAAAAHQETEQSLMPALQKLADSVAQVARARDSIREESTDDLVRLALAIASRVMHRDVTLDSTVLAGLLRSAFAKLRSQEVSVANVHPVLEPILRRCLERGGGVPSNLYLLTDSKLKPGRLVIDTDAPADASAPAGAIASVDLNEIERGLTDRLTR